MKLHKSMAGFVMVTVIMVACASSAFAAWGSKELETEQIAVTFAREVARGGYDIVTAKELKDWMDQKKDMLIVDTMPYEASYKKQHVKGAVQMEFPIPEMASMDDNAKAAFEKLLGPDKDRLIVFYCGFVKCTRSHNGAMWAKKLGYRNVYRFPGGIKAWDEGDYPMGKVD
ncbi:MAG TPA: rhodanese-like domain-containing protein [Deltaproteobacteria bacterium]|nr:rhodanese-like domain-containing protein [Deltaproteobacteria bacterium]HPR55415.1 rhodanese-like domain-containing protein [Deltaproteobacteria bacterium]HXK48145.1 rhodanese-like domain-containing protein [Deltaproteobacteria bacterium]